MKNTSTPNPPGTPVRAKLLYGIREVAEMLGISRSSVYGYCRSGDLPFIKIGERRLIETATINDFIERMKAATLNAV